MNTTTGNRPARVAPAGCKSGQPCYYVPPQYIFNGDAPKAGENYRAALARSITSDFQFARATVNYLWAQFFGRGIVDPPNTFDPARLDPDNPPPAPWTLQPTQCRAAECAGAALRRHRGYDLKALMREIANSRHLPALQPLQRRLERGVGAVLRAQVRAPAVGRRSARCGRAVERHAALLHDHRASPTRASRSRRYAMQLPDITGPATANAHEPSSTASCAAIATTSRARATARSCRRSA